MSKLVVKLDNSVQEEIPLGAQAIDIGRTAENRLCLADGQTSRRHARIFPQGTRYFVEDLASANGTFVNGHRIKKFGLRDGDNVRIGKFTLLFIGENAATDETSSQGETVPVAATVATPAPAVADTPDDNSNTLLATSIDHETILAAHPETEIVRAHLNVIKGDLNRSRIALVQDVTNIGKDDHAEIRLKGMFAPKRVGVIRREGADYFFIPAVRGTKLNSVHISGRQKLMDGNILELQDTILEFRQEK
ncbi:MAG: FHA domain-containing protein [Magnetococcales bacterium]|nr:FHA domain-containing protein [Magnetococcales bacterium]